MSFIKLFVYLVLLSGYLQALSLKDSGFNIYLVSENKEHRILNYKLKNKILENYKLKIIVNKNIIQDKTYYLKIYCDLENIVKSNIKYKSELKNIIIKINKNTPKEINIFFTNKEEKEINIIANPIHSFEFETFYEYRNVIAGISYGIIFCAFLYSFIIYINTHFRSLLYYGLMQLFLLITLLQSHYFSSKTYDFINEDLITDYSVSLTVIMIILFSKEVLLFKKYSSFFNKIFIGMIILNLINLTLIYFINNTILYKFIPVHYFILFLSILGVISSLQGNKFSFFYTSGWIVLFISLSITEYNLLNLNTSIILNIGLPLESLILGIALGYKLKDIIREKKEKEELFLQQSKLASMGNMINNIAHQWRQPLTNLSFINMDLQMAINTNNINNKYLNTIRKDSCEQIDFMSKTLDNFKGFYQPKREKENFFVSQAVNKAINIIKPTLDTHNIKISFIVKKDKKINSYENEYSQVVLNFLSNSGDALIEQKINEPYINITLDIDECKESILKVCDNAKGIDKNIIQKIFDPYFTTKHKSTGVGLYMSKIIAESHLNAEINVYNFSEGACFELKL